MNQAISTHPGKFWCGWSEGTSNGDSSVERKKESGHFENTITLGSNVLRRLAELHTDILNTAEGVNLVQKEVLSLKQENETLRKKLPLMRSSVAEGDEPGLSSSAGSVSTVLGKGFDGPRAPATVSVWAGSTYDLRLSHEELTEIVHAGRKKVAMNEETVQCVEDKTISDNGTTFIPPKATETSIAGSEAEGANIHKRRHESQQSLLFGRPSDILLSSVGKRASHANEKSGAASNFAAGRFSRVSKRNSHAPENSHSIGVSHFLKSTNVEQKRRALGVRAMLFDPDMVKEKLKRTIAKQDFNVARLYHQEGLAQRIARSHLFETISLGVICANTLWIAVDTEHNRADVLLDADIGFQVVEHLFCTFFFLEILIRFAAFKVKWKCIWSGWFVFDGLLVVSMVIEDWIMTIVLLGSRKGAGGSGKSVSVIKNTATLRVLRLLRLLRLGRCLRLMRQSPEIMIMVKAVWGSMRCVVWTCVLIAGITFVFGVCFSQLCKDTRLEDHFFPSLTGSLHTLLIAGLFPDLETISRSINAESIIFWLIFLLYLTMTNICVLNMLVGILVEVVKNSSMIERDAMDVNFVKEVFVRLLYLTEVDDITKIFICKQAGLELLQNEEISETLTKVGIDVVGLVDLMDFIFINGEVSVASLLEIILQLRSSAAVTVKDIVEVRKFLTFEINNMKRELNGIRSSNQQLVELGAGIGRENSVLDQSYEAGNMNNQAKRNKFLVTPIREFI